jgi:phospholipid/cholesterol/gamma-HCH transport system permease protein
MTFFMTRFAGYIGRETIRRTNHLLELAALTCRIFGLFLRKDKTGRRFVRAIIAEQIYFTAIQALPIIVPIALIIGAGLILQFSKLSAQYDIGKIAVAVIIREIGPLATALVVILRSATAVTIETGYMTVQHEIEAIEMSGIDPHHVISFPRLVGITTAMLSLFLVFDLVAILGGYAIVWTTTEVPLGNFMSQIGKAISGMDIIEGIVKGICFGITITVTCLYRGYTVGTQMTMLPVATSKAAIESLFYCLVMNIVISLFFYA